MMSVLFEQYSVNFYAASAAKYLTDYWYKAFSKNAFSTRWFKHFSFLSQVQHRTAIPSVGLA